MSRFSEIKNLLENSSFYYIIETNMAGRYSFINNHYRTVFESIHNEILDQPYQITMHPDDTRVCEEVAASCFAHPDRVFPATIRKHDGKGSYFITQWEYKAIFDDQNQPAGIFCLGYDITSYSLQAAKLEEAKTLLTYKDSVLREIAFNQSHVIRKPLANILGLVMILQNMDLDQNTRNIFDMLIKSTQELDEVIHLIVNKTYE